MLCQIIRTQTLFTSPLIDKWLEGFQRRPYEKGILKLPVELIRQIYLEDALDYESCARLAITCRYLLLVGRDIIENTRDVLAAEWYGCRIICAGDYTRLRDFPDNILNETQKAKLEQMILADRAIKRAEHLAEYGPNGLHPTLWEDREPDTAYGGLELLCPNKTPIFPGLRAWDCNIHLMEHADRARYIALAGTHYPGEMEWYLCNQTKRESVRARAIAEFCGKEDDEQPFLPSCRVDLGTVLLLRICWSTCDSISMRTQKPLHRGAWVGDRLVIADHASKERFSQEEGEYTDVTEDILKELEEVLEGEFGADWVDEVVKHPVQDGYQYWYKSDNEGGVGLRCQGYRPQITRWKYDLGIC